MIEKYDIGIKFELMDESLRASIDKDGRATVLVFVDFLEVEFNTPHDWKMFTENSAILLPPKEVIEFHSEFCRDILAGINNDDLISFYTSAEVDETGSRPWTTSMRIPDQVRALTRLLDLSLLVSLDTDDDGAPTREALGRLRAVVAEAKARYDEKVHEWFWSE